MIAIETRYSGSAMDVLSEEGFALVLGGLFQSDKTPVKSLALMRTSATSMVVSAVVVAEPVVFGSVRLVVHANDGRVVVSGDVEERALVLEMTAIFNGRSFAATALVREGDEMLVSADEAATFGKALASAWLRTPAGREFHSGAMSKSAFGQDVDDIRVMDRTFSEAATPAGAAMLDYLSSVPDSAVLLVVPVTDAGCQAFHEFASAFSTDGKVVAEMENPLRIDALGSNIFLLSVAEVAVSIS